MARTLGGNHRDIHVFRRLDASKVDIEAMGEHQHIALLQIRLNVLFIHISLQLIIDQDHDNVRLFRRLGRGVHFKALRLSLRPGFAPLIKADNHPAARFLGIQGMRMSLASVTDHRDRLAIQ